MALCQFPLNLHTISSSTTSSPQFRRLQPLDASVKSNFLIRRLRFRNFNHAVRLSTRGWSVIVATIDIDTHQRKKTKRKPKPGFFDEISDKWSSRISPKTEKLPWQKQEEQIQHHEDEEEDEEEDKSSSNLSSGYKRNDSNRLYSASEPSSFPRPSGYMSAPWVNNGGSKGVNFTTSSEQGIQSWSFDDVITVDRYRSDNDSSNRAVGSDLDDGERGVIDSGKYKGIWRTRRSNTVEAERIVPEHELRRLRNVALRMVERVKVGSAGITQALVEAIHEKWEVDEVVKLKFSEPFTYVIVKWSRILYSDFSTFKRDQERLISMTNDLGVDFLEGHLMMSNGIVDTSFFPHSDQTRVASLVNDHRIIYVLEVAKYYDSTTLPIIDQVIDMLTRTLGFPPGFMFVQDVPYFDFLNRVRNEEDKLRSLGLWEVPHPWLNIFVPRSRILDFHDGVISGLLLNQTATSGVTLFYPTNRNKWINRMSTMTPDEDVFYVIGLLQSAGGSQNWQELENLNDKIIQFCENSGIKIKEYLMHYTRKEDWIKHFGPKWDDFLRRKIMFDPKRLLSPGQDIFN